MVSHLSNANIFNLFQWRFNNNANFSFRWERCFSLLYFFYFVLLLNFKIMEWMSGSRPWLVYANNMRFRTNPIYYIYECFFIPWNSVLFEMHKNRYQARNIVHAAITTECLHIYMQRFQKRFFFTRFASLLFIFFSLLLKCIQISILSNKPERANVTARRTENRRNSNNNNNNNALQIYKSTVSCHRHVFPLKCIIIVWLCTLYTQNVLKCNWIFISVSFSEFVFHFRTTDRSGFERWPSNFKHCSNKWNDSCSTLNLNKHQSNFVEWNWI